MAAYPRCTGYFGRGLGALTPSIAAAYPPLVARSGGHARSRERVVRICASAVEARNLRLDVLAEIRRVVAFDAYAWLLTDPETWVGSSPLADVPCLPELPTLIRLKYLTEVNRWTRLDLPVALLREATGDDPARSLLWRDLLVRYGIGDVASSVYTDRYGCGGFLDLWRAATAEANSFVARAARRQTARGPVVLLLSCDLEVRAQTPQTQEYLRMLVPPDADQSPVPASAYNVAAQLLANEAGVDMNPPSARVHLSDGVWLTLRAARIGDATAAPQLRDIAVSIEECSPAERAGLFARAFGLSAREAELLGHLATGSDTKDLSTRMSLSPHTVQDHLKSIFAKTSVNSRGTLLSRALGT